MRQQWLNMADSYARVTASGGDPLRETTPLAQNVDPQVALEFIPAEWAQRQAAREEFMSTDPMVRTAIELFDNQMEQFKIRNQGPMATWSPNMPPDVREVWEMQLQREPMAESVQQNLLDALNYAEGKLKEIDPSMSVGTDRQLGPIVRAMERMGARDEAIFSLAPELQEGSNVFQRTAAAFNRGAMHPMGGMADLMVQLGFAMTGGLNSEWYKQYQNTQAPNEVYVDSNGMTVHNGGKISPESAPWQVLRLLTGKTVDEVRQFGRSYDEAFDWSQAQVQGGEVYVNAIAAATGFLSGFMATGGGFAVGQSTKAAGMLTARMMGLQKSTQFMSQGAARLLTGKTQNVVKLAKVLSSVGGAGIGTAMWEMGVNGRVEGYGHAAIEGMKMGPVFALAGAAGRWLEKYLKNYPKMPARLKKTFEGMFEGMVIDVAQLTSLESAAWNFMKDPTDPDKMRDWSVGLVASMVSFGIFKGLTGTNPVDFADLNKVMKPAELEAFRARIEKVGQQAQAAKAAEKPEDVASIAKKAGVRPETVKEYGEALREQDKGKTPELAQKLMDLESKLDLEEYALDLSPAERADARTALRQHIADLTREGAEEAELEVWRDRLELLGEKTVKPAKKKFTPSFTPPRTYPERPEKYYHGEMNAASIRHEVERLKMQPSSPEKTLRITEMLNMLQGTVAKGMIEGLEQAMSGRTPDKGAGRHPAGTAGPYSLLKGQPRSRTEQVISLEGEGPIEAVDIPPLPTPAKRMFQEGGDVGLTEVPKVNRREAERRQREKYLKQGRDPLEDPAFEERPQAEKDALLAMGSKLERLEYEAETMFPEPAVERRTVDRRKDDFDEFFEKEEFIDPDQTIPRDRPIRFNTREEYVRNMSDKVVSYFSNRSMRLPPDMTAQAMGNLIWMLTTVPKDMPPGRADRQLVQDLIMDVPSLAKDRNRAAMIVAAARNAIRPMQHRGGPIQAEPELPRTIEQQAAVHLSRFKELWADEFGQRVHPDEGVLHLLLMAHLKGQSRDLGDMLKGLTRSDPIDMEVIRRMLVQIAGPPGTGTAERPMAVGPGEPGIPKSLQLSAQEQMAEHPAAAELIKKWGRIEQPDILKRMEGFEGDPVRAPIRKNLGVKGASAGAKKWVAVYKQREHLIRTNEMRNDAANAHEFSHAMEEAAIKAGLWDPVNVEPWMREAFAEIASTYPDYADLSPREQIAEGWAEFWARWQLGDARLYGESPELHNWAMKWLTSPEANAKGFTDQVTEVAELTRLWKLMGAEKRAASIYRAPGEPITRMQRRSKAHWVDRFATGFSKYVLDDIVELRKAEKKWYDIAGINPGHLRISLRPSSLIDAFRMTAHQQAVQMWEEGTHDIAGNRTGESGKDILKDLEETGVLENWVQYVNAKRAVNRIDQGEEMPMDREDAMFVVEKWEGSNPEFYDYADRMRQFSKRVLNYGVEAGLFTEAEVESMLEKDPIYLPFARINEFAGKMVSPGRGVAERGTGVAAMHGGPEQIKDPIDELQNSIKGIITKAQQNMVMRSMYLSHKMLRGMGGFITEVPRDADPKEVLIERVSEEITRLGGKIGKKAEAKQVAEGLEELLGGEGDAAAAKAMTFWFQKAVPSGAAPVLAFRPKFTEAELDRLNADRLPPTKPAPKGVKADQWRTLADEMRHDAGTLRWYEVDADAYNAMMGVDQPTMGMENWPAMLRGMVVGPTTAVRWGATILNADFIVRNMIRDPLTRQLFTKSENKKDRLFMGFGALAAGAAARAKGVLGAQIFKALGLEGSTRVGVDIGREKLDGKIGSIVRPLAAVAEFLGEPEKWLRTTEFIEARDRLLKLGYSEFDANMEASLAAKEVTVNFTRAGVLGRLLTQVYPYFNPRMQGLRKFWRAVGGAEGKGAQKQALVRGLANMGGLSMLAWWLGRNQDWYEDLPIWRKVNFWTFDMSFATGSDTPDLMSFPKPFEAGIMFGSTVENALTAFDNYDEEMTKEVMTELLAQHLVGWPFIPALVLPALESKIWDSERTGYSYFFQRPIVPDWQLKSRVDADQYNAYTTRTFRWLGEAFGVSPTKLEYLVTQYGGGLPRKIIQSVEAMTGISEMAWTMNTIPGFGTLFSQRPHQSGRAEDTVHDIEYQLGKLSGSGYLTGRGKGFRSRISKARERIRHVRELQRNGRITLDEANLRTYKIAHRLAVKWESMKESDYIRDERQRRR